MNAIFVPALQALEELDGLTNERAFPGARLRLARVQASLDPMLTTLRSEDAASQNVRRLLDELRSAIDGEGLEVIMATSADLRRALLALDAQGAGAVIH